MNTGEVIGILFLLGVISALFYFMYKIAQKRPEKDGIGYWNNYLKTVSKNFNLLFKESWGGRLPAASGVIKGLRVKIFREDLSEKGKAVNTVMVSIAIPEKRVKQIDLSKENFISNLLKRGNHTDIEMADPLFDDKAFVGGDSLYDIHALLHPEVRRLITRFIDMSFKNKFEIKYGTLRINMNTDLFPEIKTFVTAFKDLISLAEYLARTGLTGQLLAENYQSEQNEETKKIYMQSLFLLKKEKPETIISESILKDAMESGVPLLQFYSVCFSSANTNKYISRFYDKSEPELKTDILEFLSSINDPELLPFFIGKFKDCTDLGEKMAIVHYWGAVSAVELENVIIEEIKKESSAHSKYAVACISALGGCGKYKSIAFLDDIKEFPTRKLIEQSIIFIQQRIGSGDEGWLSVQKEGGDSGKLSVADDKK